MTMRPVAGIVGMRIGGQRPRQRDLDVADMIRRQRVVRDDLEIGGIDRVVDGADHAAVSAVPLRTMTAGTDCERGRMQPENARTQRAAGFRRGGCEWRSDRRDPRTARDRA